MNVKMYLPDTADKPREMLSAEVQRHASHLGVRLTIWRFHDLFIFIDGSEIAYSNDFNEFDDYIGDEVTPEQFLAIPIPEPRCRPYFDKEVIDIIGEIVLDKLESKEHEISNVKIEKHSVSINIVTNSWVSTLECPRTLLDNFTFIDGSPCGVLLGRSKED